MGFCVIGWLVPWDFEVFTICVVGCAVVGFGSVAYS